MLTPTIYEIKKLRKDTVSFESYDDLMNSQSLFGFTENDTVYLKGYYHAGDGAHHYRIKKGNNWNVVCDYCVNVKHFGAKGDNVTNDTVSVQNAIDYLYNNISSVTNSELNTNTYSASSYVLYFPKGKYIVDTMNMGHYIHMHGEKSLIKSTTNDFIIKAKINGSICGWRGKISNIIFNGTKVLNFNTRTSETNLDVGHMNIVDCEFKGCDIICDMDTQSCQVWFSHCIIENFTKIRVRHCDGFHIDNCWIYPKQNSVADYESFIEFGGSSLVFSNNVCVPKPQQAKEVAYIENTGNGKIVLHNNRFGGEPGSHALLNYKVQNSNVYSMVSIHDNNITTVVDRDNACIVRLFSKPKYIHIGNNSGCIDLPYYIKLSETYSASTLVSECADLNIPTFDIMNNSFLAAYSQSYIDRDIDYMVFSKRYHEIFFRRISQILPYKPASVTRNDMIVIPIKYLKGTQFYYGEVGWNSGLFELNMSINKTSYFVQYIQSKICIYNENDSNNASYLKITNIDEPLPVVSAPYTSSISQVLMGITNNTTNELTWVSELVVPSASNLTHIGIVMDSEHTVSRVNGLKLTNILETQYYKR